MNPDFSILAGVALLIFAIFAPLSYCTVQRGGPTSANDLHLACINAKGEWKKGDGWMDTHRCEFPKAAQSQ
jgi:hypothetical protein